MSDGWQLSMAIILLTASIFTFFDVGHRLVKLSHPPLLFPLVSSVFFVWSYGIYFAMEWTFAANVPGKYFLVVAYMISAWALFFWTDYLQHRAASDESEGVHAKSAKHTAANSNSPAWEPLAFDIKVGRSLVKDPALEEFRKVHWIARARGIP